MFNHQYDFRIEIPKEVITEKKHDKIFEELLENKTLIGLCGYGKSGKDYIAKKFIDGYGFHRVAFADNIKIEMNEHLKEAVYELLKNHTKYSVLHNYKELDGGLKLIDGRILTLEEMDFQTEDIPMKKKLRPFIIWYGEKLREINGPYYWVNKAFEVDAAGHDKIILSDVRRIKELEPFKWSNYFHKKSMEKFINAGISNHPDLTKKKKPYSALLFHVSQFMLTDKDVLTHECIRLAQENWMFNYTFYVDPRLPESGKSRERSIDNQIKEVVGEFKIETPDKRISPRQIKMF